MDYGEKDRVMRNMKVNLSIIGNKAMVSIHGVVGIYIREVT